MRLCNHKGELGEGSMVGRSARRGTHEPLGFIVVNSGKLIVRFDLGLYIERQYQGAYSNSARLDN